MDQARDGRMHILGEMANALGIARPEMRETVPRVITINIPTDKIGAVIGAGGKTIREITERTGTKVDIGDDGTVKIASSDALASQRAIDWIRGLTATAEVGHIYEGKVARIVDFGAFITFLGSQDGLCHISELANERVGKVVRRRQGRRHGEGQGPGDRRPRQGQAQHALGRPGDRRGDRGRTAAATRRSPPRRPRGRWRLAS